MKKIIWLSLLLGGCAVGPNYVPPENNVSNEWQAPTPTYSYDAPLTEWWKIFNDPLLTKYIETAAVYNNDVLVAEANVLKARAMKKVSASKFFPQINADLNATKTYFSKNGPVFAIGPSTGSLPGTVSSVTGLPFAVQIPQIQNLFNALFDATWEIDLFGKTRRSVQAAEAMIGSAEENRNDTLLSVMAEVAKNYVEIRQYQKNAVLVEENIRLLEQNLEVVRQRKETGYSNQLDVETIEAQLANARSTLPNLIAEVYREIYAISVLTGNVPEALSEELLPMQPLPQVPSEIAVGLRSDLLRRRPDVRRAERDLAAAVANVGVAVASFFPTITLIGDGGFQSLHIGNLFSLASRTWAVGGDINIPVFQGGKLVYTLKANRAAAQAATFTYQQAVLTALQDAESGLIAYSEDLVTKYELNEVVQRERNLVFLTKERFEKGLVNVLDLISSETQLITAEENLLNSDAKTLLDLIALYKALGGGWEKFDENQKVDCVSN